VPRKNNFDRWDFRRDPPVVIRVGRRREDSPEEYRGRTRRVYDGELCCPSCFRGRMLTVLQNRWDFQGVAVSFGRGGTR